MSLAVSHAKASSIFPLTSLGYAISLFLSTACSRLVGTKKSIVLSLLVTGVGVACAPLARTLSGLYVFVFLIGMGVGLYLPNAIPLITDSYPERYWGRALSLHETATAISIFAAPLLALFLLAFTGWRGILELFGATCFACALVFFAVGHDVKGARPKGLLSAHLFRHGSIWIIGILWIFAAGSNLGLYFVIPLYFVKELGMAEGHANAVLGASRLGAVLVAVSVGFAVDRFSLKKIASVLLFASGIATMGLALPDPSWIKVILFAQAALSAAFFPLSLVTISRLFGQETRGQATAFIVMLGVVFGVGVIPYLLGLSGDLVSFRFGILLLGCGTAASSFLYGALKGLR